LGLKQFGANLLRNDAENGMMSSLYVPILRACAMKNEPELVKSYIYLFLDRAKRNSILPTANSKLS